MSESKPTIVRPDGRLARDDGRCPRCDSGEERRVNTSGFGPPVICCADCGHEFKGAKE